MTGMSELSLQPGTVLGGKYVVERVIGQGGMGVVVAAYHMQLEQRVALKLMWPQATENPEAVSRFFREARAAARISSEHVVRVFDVGALEDGAPYIAMEYLQGADLGQVLVARGRLAAEEAIDYLLQACEALAEAHAAGVVHRDLKPGNLFLAQRVDGQQLIKVLDFGISKMTALPGASAQVTMTQTSALMGSPLYMSPEQMASAKAVDARSDVWALGVVAYEMLSGTPPFVAQTLPQVCAMILTEEPHSLAARVPSLSSTIVSAVERCLRKDPAHRYQSVAELAAALEPVASPRARQSIERIARVLNFVPAPHAPPSVLPVNQIADAGSGYSGTNAPWADTKPPVVKRRFPMLWLGTVLALGLATFILGFLRRAAPVSLAVNPTVSAAPPVASESAEPPPSMPLVASSVAITPAVMASQAPARPSPAPPAASPAAARATTPAAPRAASSPKLPSALAVPVQAPPSATVLPAPAATPSNSSPKPASTRSRL
jgi:serine/threonine protein kinase